MCWLFVGGAFGRCLNCEGEALMNEISVLIKEAPERSLTPPTTRGQSKLVGAGYEPGGGPPLEPDHAGT